MLHIFVLLLIDNFVTSILNHIWLLRNILKMFSKALLSLAALVSCTQAAPLEARQFDNYYIKPTVKLNDSPLNGAVINANNGSFFIGKATTTSCPGEIYPCQTFSNTTAINVYQTGSGASMVCIVSSGLQHFK